MEAPTEDHPRRNGDPRPAARQILATLYALETRDEEWPGVRPDVITRRHVRNHAARFWLGDSLLPWDGAWIELGELGLLRGRGEGVALTDAGRGPGLRWRNAFRRRRFEQILVEAERSATFLDFLRRTGDLDVRAFSPLDRRQLDAVFDALGPAEAAPRVLDIGCGAGHVTAAIVRRRGGSALGIDYAAEAIELARRRVAAHGPPGVELAVLDFETADRSALDRASPGGGEVDAAVAVDSLVFAEDLEAATARVLSCLRSGGALVVLALETGRRPGKAPMARVFEALAVPFSRLDLSASALPLLRSRQFAA
ncbi:MAG: class I SAM-dependent methyltransferase, partial [Acidobacteriota bacterium]